MLKLKQVLKSLILGSAATLSSLLFGVYAKGEPLHEVRNGFPLPFLVQKIQIDPASLIGLELNPLNLLVDLLFWALLFYLMDARKTLRRTKLEMEVAAEREAMISNTSSKAVILGVWAILQPFLVIKYICQLV